MKERFVNPFSPNLPIDDPDRFTGRVREIGYTIDSLYQLCKNTPTHTIITGDRGIGKSSLLHQTKLLAEGDNRLADKFAIDIGVEKFNYLCAWHDCTTDQTPIDLTEGILTQLQDTLTSFFSRLKKTIDIEINIANIVNLRKADEKQHRSNVSSIVNQFCAEITKLSEKIAENEKDGIILFFDELDRVNPTSGVATFFKLTAEKLNRDKIKNVAFFAAGITGAIQNLEEDHASIYRLFKDISLPKFEENDARQILTDGFSRVNCNFDDAIINKIFTISAGYPEIIHVMGSQLLSVDKDDNLDDEDFQLAKQEVIETIKRNHLSTMLKNAGSGKYQKILGAMAKYTRKNIPLSYICDEIGYQPNQFSTNMSNLVKREIIDVVERGVYCFTTPLLKEYISRFGVINAIEEEAETE